MERWCSENRRPASHEQTDHTMLIVLLPEPLLAAGLESPPLYWWRLGREGGLLESGQDDLPALRRRYPAERLRLLAPATATSLYRVSIPVRRASAARAALPFALERSEEHTSELQSRPHLVCRLLLEKKKNK